MQKDIFFLWKQWKHSFETINPSSGWVFWHFCSTRCVFVRFIDGFPSFRPHNSSIVTRQTFYLTPNRVQSSWRRHECGAESPASSGAAVRDSPSLHKHNSAVNKLKLKIELFLLSGSQTFLHFFLYPSTHCSPRISQRFRKPADVPFTTSEKKL